jgi:hypothetical protein
MAPLYLPFHLAVTNDREKFKGTPSFYSHFGRNVLECKKQNKGRTKIWLRLKSRGS